MKTNKKGTIGTYYGFRQKISLCYTIDWEGETYYHLLIQDNDGTTSVKINIMQHDMESIMYLITEGYTRSCSSICGKRTIPELKNNNDRDIKWLVDENGKPLKNKGEKK